MTEHERMPPLGELKATRRDVPHRPARAPEPARPSAVGYQEYDLLLRASPPRGLGIFQQLLAILVRLLGLGLLVVGIGAAIFILHEAWMLYQEPTRIEKFAVAIERGSNLDKIFALSGGETDKADAQGEDTGAQPGASESAVNTSFRPSYFAGWFLVLLLMLVASIVAISAISAGGRLVLFDTDIRQLSRAVVKEVRRNKAT